MKIFSCFRAWQPFLLLCLGGCQPVAHNTAELIDPWLRDRTIESLRLQGQVGESVISTDWRHDDEGTITVSLIVDSDDDLKNVLVSEIIIKDQGEYTATASVQAGDAIDLSGGSGQIVVTAYNGETRIYTILYSKSNYFGGTFSFGAEQSSLGWGSPTYCFFAGGPDSDTRTGSILDHDSYRTLSQDDGRWPNDESDNLVSFKYTYYDPDTGMQSGTFVNTTGKDGKYADFYFKEYEAVDGIVTDNLLYERDCNSIYRLIPRGCGRWTNVLGSDIYTFYRYEDETFMNPLVELQMLQPGTYTIEYPGVTIADFCPKTITIPGGGFAFTRHLQFEYKEAPGISNFVAENVRQVWWIMVTESGQCLENHDELVSEMLVLEN